MKRLIKQKNIEIKSKTSKIYANISFVLIMRQ